MEILELLFHIAIGIAGFAILVYLVAISDRRGVDRDIQEYLRSKREKLPVQKQKQVQEQSESDDGSEYVPSVVVYGEDVIPF